MFMKRKSSDATLINKINQQKRFVFLGVSHFIEHSRFRDNPYDHCAPAGFILTCSLILVKKSFSRFNIIFPTFRISMFFSILLSDVNYMYIKMLIKLFHSNVITTPSFKMEQITCVLFSEWRILFLQNALVSLHLKI